MKTARRDNNALGAYDGQSEDNLINKMGGSFHLQKNLRTLVEELREDPDADVNDRIEAAVDEDFPLVHRFPTAENMDDSVTNESPDPRLKFEQGQWCEYLGLDMAWHLSQVKRVVKVAPDDFNPRTSEDKPVWEFYYNFDSGQLLPRNKLRAPEEGLKRLFGYRPWVWQQWALLKTEDYCRFQELHERDFEMMNFRMSAHQLWQQWLDDPRNADFKALFESRTKREREKLINHLHSPWIFADQLSKQDGPGMEWDFEEERISCYIYPSLLGGGWLTALVVLALQVMIPALLLYAAIYKSGRFTEINPFYFQTDLAQFCSKSGPTDGLIINVCVLVFYTVRQLPAVLYAFFETTGEADTTRSRINSLRRIVWELGTDSPGMMFGYKMEKYMNSIYIAIVNSVMLFVLFLTDDPPEIILNALAIEFVVYFDGEVASSQWMDPDTRYLRAGAIELLFRRNMALTEMGDAKAFCKRFDIAYDQFKEAIKGDGHWVSSAFNIRKLAADDDDDLRWQTPKNKVWAMASDHAEETGNHIALQVFRETPGRFDSIFSFLAMFDDLWLCRRFGVSLGGSAIFTRFKNYHTWSRWDKVLFLAPCTKVTKQGEDNYSVDIDYKSELLVSVREDMAGKPLPDNFLNDSWELNYGTETRFLVDIYRTLTFQALMKSVKISLRKGNIPGVVVRFVDGCFEWLAYLIQILFPLTILGFLILLLACY